MSETITLCTSIQVGPNLFKPKDVRYRRSEIKRYYEGSHSRETILVLEDGREQPVGHSVEYVDRLWKEGLEMKPTDDKKDEIVQTVALEETVESSNLPDEGHTGGSKKVAKPRKRKKVVQAKKSNKRKPASKVARKNPKRSKSANVRGGKRAKAASRGSRSNKR